MSDFSAAYHLKTTDRQLVIDLLNKANLKGYVFEPVNGWTTFVADADEYKPVASITTHNKGLLLHFDRTNDFLCWGFHIYQNQTLVGKYNISSKDGETIRITNHTDNASLGLLVDTSQLENLQKLLEPVDIKTAYKHGDYDFAQLIGLKNFEWVSFSFIKRHTEDYNVIIVD